MPLTDADIDFFKQISEEARKNFQALMDDPLQRVDMVQHLFKAWAYFDISVVSPTTIHETPLMIHHPESIGQKVEHVYEIYDTGNRLWCSKAEDMFTAGMSMCRLYYTIEKIIAILIDRLKSAGIPPENEVQVVFGGFDSAQRKAFESIINLRENIVVNNYDPGEWGERFLEIIKNLSDRGYGFPPEAPRTIYREKLSERGSGSGAPKNR